MKKLFLLFALFTLAGCSGKNASLTCNDKQVTDQVMNITKSELQEQLFKAFYRNETSIITRDIAVMTYSDFKANATNELGRKIVEQTDSTIASLTLADMRLQGKNETTGMISCAANLAGKNKVGGEIGYSAQFTDEGKLHVEVTGL